MHIQCVQPDGVGRSFDTLSPADRTLAVLAQNIIERLGHKGLEREVVLSRTYMHGE